MKTLKLAFVLCFLAFVSGCTENNQEIEKKITNSVNNFHALFNQEKFDQIYAEADDKLKTELTEQQFVSYLDVVKKNDIYELEQVPEIHINNESNSEIERILFKNTIFFNTITVYTEKGIYLEHFEWDLKDGKAKLVSYMVNKAQDNHQVIID